MDVSVWLMLSGFLVVMMSVTGLDRDLSCAVCRALVDEVNFDIGKVDPKKKIQVGSFRVDSRGNQGTYEKSYARSEVHLLEVFEGLCEKFRQYAESTNSAGQRSIARIETRLDGKALALKNIKVNPEIQKLIKFRCETLVEEYEDEMIALFRRENLPDIERAICADLTSQCSGEDLEIPMPQSEIDENVVIPDDEDDDVKDKPNDEDNETKDKPVTDTDDVTVDIPNEKASDTTPSEQTGGNKAEGTENPKEHLDEELFDQYLRDNLDIDKAESDKIIEKRFKATDGTAKDGKKEEL